MRKHLLKLIFAVFLLFVVETLPIHAAVTPHHHNHISKERVKDGVYVGRDAYHIEQGEHNVDFDHEAIIGNVKEAQEFDTLSPAESKRRLLALVKIMDSNGDGYVDRHELRAWILRSFKKLSEEEAADRFAEIDENDDNKISWKEYMADTYSMEGDNEHSFMDTEVNDEEKNLIRDDKEMFNAADLDKDGQLSADEFVLFQNPEEHPAMLPIVLEHTLRDKDKNSDGHIDFQEYIGESATGLDKEALLAEKDRYANDYDLNHDGVLTGSEILAWVVPNNDDIADDEVDHLFASTDEDHDNRLSYGEILDNYDTFVGSEATDYGSHLENINHLADEL